MIACSSCGQENPEGFRLCGMCGASLLPEPTAAREERKVVTVLFCDLVGHAGEQLIEQGRRAEGEAQLRQALDFYRSVGASYYLERGEALLARTA